MARISPRRQDRRIDFAKRLTNTVGSSGVWLFAARIQQESVSARRLRSFRQSGRVIRVTCPPVQGSGDLHAKGQVPLGPKTLEVEC